MGGKRKREKRRDGAALGGGSQATEKQTGERPTATSRRHGSKRRRIQISRMVDDQDRGRPERHLEGYVVRHRGSPAETVKVPRGGGFGAMHKKWKLSRIANMERSGASVLLAPP